MSLTLNELGKIKLHSILWILWILIRRYFYLSSYFVSAWGFSPSLLNEFWKDSSALIEERMNGDTAWKPYFLFPNILKRWSFQKHRTGIWSFLYYLERWYFFFPKYILSQKIHGNMIFSSNASNRRFFQKIILVLSGKMGFFSGKIWYFLIGQKMKDDLSQEIHRNRIFSVHVYKNQGRFSLKKYT